MRAPRARPASAGLGGGLFVGANGNVTLIDVNFSGDSAHGGNGANGGNAQYSYKSGHEGLTAAPAAARVPPAFGPVAGANGGFGVGGGGGGFGEQPQWAPAPRRWLLFLRI